MDQLIIFDIQGERRYDDDDDDDGSGSGDTCILCGFIRMLILCNYVGSDMFGNNVCYVVQGCGKDFGLILFVGVSG